jgi:hypothetical protein
MFGYDSVAVHLVLSSFVYAEEMKNYIILSGIKENSP